MKLRFLTAGESHGKALMGIIDGLPSGVPLTSEQIQRDMRRRKLGYGRGFRQQIEGDVVEILCGIRHGRTIGAPVGLVLFNQDFSAWTDIMQVEPAPGAVRRRVEVPRPGHADLVGSLKYKHDDMRNVLERSSARETAMRVAVAATARAFLEAIGVHVASRVTSIGKHFDETAVPKDLSTLNERADRSPVRCLGKSTEKKMIAEVERAKKSGDTLGGTFEVIAWGVPVGLGSYAQWDRRLEASIGRSILSLNAIKGVDIGLGFRSAETLGSRAHDEIFPSRRARTEYRTNRSGGIDGGMSTGQPIVVRAAMKPLSTLMKPLRSVHLETGKATKAHVERSDVCAVPSAAVIGESLVCLDLASAILDKFGGDSLAECRKRLEEWKRDTRQT